MCIDFVTAYRRLGFAPCPIEPCSKQNPNCSGDADLDDPIAVKIERLILPEFRLGRASLPSNPFVSKVADPDLVERLTHSAIEEIPPRPVHRSGDPIAF